MLRERYLHPNGQIPGLRMELQRRQPAGHAWATIFTYRIEKELRGEADVDFLKKALQEAAAEFHLVGQSQGSDRQQCV